MGSCDEARRTGRSRLHRGRTGEAARGPLRFVAAALVGLAATVAGPMAGAQETAPQETTPQEAGAEASGFAKEILSIEGDDGPAVLEADTIQYDAEADVVRAMGDVEIYFDDRVLLADEVIYDAAADQVTAIGDVRLVNADGSVLLADRAEFNTRLNQGLIEGARATLADGQSRLAAVEGRKIDDRYTTLSKAVFSPCEVCAENPTPLWRIRARRVIQDNETKDIIYQDAFFDVFGQPIGWLPTFRHPDPSVTRRSGFLVPSLKSSKSLGQSVQTPYFWNLAPNRDLTITPMIATQENPVLQVEYRALTESGPYRFAGSVTDSDDAAETGFRGDVGGSGKLTVGDDFQVGYDFRVASDDSYLRRYRFSSTDVLTQRAYAQRFTDTGFISIETLRYQSFRDDEAVGEVPMIAPLIEVQQFVPDGALGGEFEFNASAIYLNRSDGGSLRFDSEGALLNQRDVGRLSGSIGWGRTVATPQGVVIEGFSQVRADGYRTLDDPAFDDFEMRVLPYAGLRASFPLGRTNGDGVYEIFEPVGSVVFAGDAGRPGLVPNEDSQDVELDELSIFEINRFAGLDRWESGFRATVGLRYQRIDPSGFEIETSLGQSYRLEPSDEFTAGSGLSGTQSDIVGAWRISHTRYFTISHRFRIDDGFEFQRNEFYLEARPTERFRLSSTLVALEGDPEGGSADERSDREELNGRAEFDVTPRWTLVGGMRRNLEAGRYVTTSGGLRYADECCELDLIIQRRFNETDDVPASTDFGIAIRLKGLGE